MLALMDYISHAIFKSPQVDFQMHWNELEQVAAPKAGNQSENLRYTWQ